MVLIPFKMSDLSETEKYHVFVSEAHTYFASKFNKNKGVFETYPCQPWIEALRPKEIVALGAEFIMHKDAYKRSCPSYVVVKEIKENGVTKKELVDYCL